MKVDRYVCGFNETRKKSEVREIFSQGRSCRMYVQVIDSYTSEGSLLAQSMIIFLTNNNSNNDNEAFYLYDDGNVVRDVDSLCICVYVSMCVCVRNFSAIALSYYTLYL